MFEDSLFASAGKLKSSSPMTVAISFLLQSIALGIMVLIPLVYTEALPSRQMMSILVTPPPPPAPPPPEVAVPVHERPLQIQPRREMVQPTYIPSHIVMLREEPIPPSPIVHYVNPKDTNVNNLASNLLSGTITVAPPPPLPPAPERIQIGGQVAAAKLVYQPRPVYPPLARQARIQGTVRLQALISKDGAIENLTVLNGHPLLIPAALDAVRQWRYQPTLLNGVPVEVETTIDVNFTLGG